MLNTIYLRQFEERELAVQEDRAKKRLEFENAKMRLVNQLEFEKSRDTQGNFSFRENVVLSLKRFKSSIKPFKSFEFRKYILRHFS